jgi:hypothetical protein
MAWIKEAELSNCRIYIYAAGEHPPPHFHIRGPNSRASVDIVTLELVKGKADRKDLREAREWALISENTVILLNAWRTLCERD